MTWEVGKRYKTRGGWEATLVAKDLRGCDGTLLFIHHKEREDDFTDHTLDGSYIEGTRSQQDILPPAPPPPQLTATDLVMRRAVVRYADGSVSPMGFRANIKQVAGLKTEPPDSYCIPPPTIPEGWEPEWRPLSEVDLTR